MNETRPRESAMLVTLNELTRASAMLGGAPSAHTIEGHSHAYEAMVRAIFEARLDTPDPAVAELAKLRAGVTEFIGEYLTEDLIHDIHNADFAAAERLVEILTEALRFRTGVAL